MPAAPSSLPDLAALLPEVGDIAEQAADAILAVRKKGFEVYEKTDHSPVTDADLISHRYISTQLSKLLPSVPIVSEEGQHIDYQERKDSRFCWLVDPLDGTREFVNNRDDFTVNIALIENNCPCLGVVYAPMYDLHYSAVAGCGATVQNRHGERTPLKVCKALPNPPRVLLGRGGPGSRMRKFLSGFGQHELIYRGSLIKCCLIAEGSADLYISFGNTSEWDTAAAQCILEEAGGCLLDFRGDSLKYNQRDTLNNPPFIASAADVSRWRLLAAGQTAAR